MDDELWSAERVGRELNDDHPLTPAAARKEMHRAGIRSVRISGYPAELVRRYRGRRKGRGHRTDLEKD
jgi:hypothetical protein